METIKYVKLACGRHWASPEKRKEGDACTKCPMHERMRASGAYQRNGVPWIAVLGPEVPKPKR